MRFLHGTNTIALKEILKTGCINLPSKTKQANLCRVTTTMQDAIYLTTEHMFAEFYTPRRKSFVESHCEYAYACVLEMELDYDDLKENFKADEDYVNDIMIVTDYSLYQKYIKENDIHNYVCSMTEFVKTSFKDMSRVCPKLEYSDIDFRYLLLVDRKLGETILSEIDPNLSLEIGGCIAYMKEIPISCIKSMMLKDIFERITDDISLNGLNAAISKVDFNLDAILYS